MQIGIDDGSSSPDELADDVRIFILNAIDLIAQLEALLLLRNNSTVCWTPKSLAVRLYVPETQALEVLSGLEKRGLAVSSNDEYRFGCKTAHLEQLVDRLADTYREQLIPVTNLVHAKQPRIQEFADAFKLRKND